MEKSNGESISHKPTAGTTREIAHGAHSGILVVNVSQQVLHVNARALELERRMNPAAPNLQRHILLNPVIADLYQGVRRSLEGQMAEGIVEQFKVHSLRAIGASATVILQGFGLPGVRNHYESRIVIVMREEDQHDPVARWVRSRKSVSEEDKPKPVV